MKEQRLIVETWRKVRLSREDQAVYDSRCFYSVTKHLQEAGIFSVDGQEEKQKFYKLTLKGEILALMLLSLK